MLEQFISLLGWNVSLGARSHNIESAPVVVDSIEQDKMVNEFKKIYDPLIENFTFEKDSKIDAERDATLAKLDKELEDRKSDSSVK